MALNLEIRSLDLWSVVKTVFIISWFLYLLIGNLLVLAYIFILTLFSSLVLPFGHSNGLLPLSPGVPFALFISVFIATSAAVFNTVMSALGVVLYNALARWAGGIRMTVVTSEEHERRKATILQPVRSKEEDEKENGG